MMVRMLFACFVLLLAWQTLTAAASPQPSGMRRRPNGRSGQAQSQDRPSSRPQLYPSVSALHIETAAAHGRAARHAVELGSSYAVSHPIAGVVGAAKSSINGRHGVAGAKLVLAGVGGLAGAQLMGFGAKSAGLAAKHVVKAGVTAGKGEASPEQYIEHQLTHFRLGRVVTAHKQRNERLQNILLHEP